MKPLEILNTIAVKHGHESWSKATFFIHERFLDDVIFEAMDLYAEQAQLNKLNIMQAEGSEKQPYFKLSTNEYGKHWLFYKPSKGEEGKYSCWLPIDDEFYSAFDELQKAALVSEAAVGKEREAKGVRVGICKQDYIHWSEDILKCRCCGHKKRA